MFHGVPLMRSVRDFQSLFFGATFFLASAAPAFALKATPVPLAGLAGPYGLLAAGLVYGGYRAVKYLRK